MVTLPKTTTDRVPPRLESDARSIVPVSDEIGGTAVYQNGRLAYYVLNGEWFPAVPERGPQDGRTTTFRARRDVSTS